MTGGGAEWTDGDGTGGGAEWSEGDATGGGAGDGVIVVVVGGGARKSSIIFFYHRISSRSFGEWNLKFEWPLESEFVFGDDDVNSESKIF